MKVIGNKVKLFLINSLSVEGLVESWQDQQVVLISNNKRLVINDPQKNIIMYYIFEESDLNNLKENKINKKHFWEIEESVTEDLNIKDQNLKLKKLAELKAMSAEAQREQIRRELTTFKPIDPSQILGKYGTPSFISSQHSTTKEINDGNANDTGSMSQVSGEESK